VIGFFLFVVVGSGIGFHSKYNKHFFEWFRDVISHIQFLLCSFISASSNHSCDSLKYSSLLLFRASYFQFRQKCDSNKFVIKLFKNLIVFDLKHFQNFLCLRKETKGQISVVWKLGVIFNMKKNLNKRKRECDSFIVKRRQSTAKLNCTSCSSGR
jgi:hypothetical protein